MGAADLGFEEWLRISDAEASRDLFYLTVLEDLAEASAKDPAFGQIARPKLVFVTGGDRWWPLEANHPGVDGVVVVPRDGDEIPPFSQLPKWVQEDPLRVVAEPLGEGIHEISSSLLRYAANITFEKAGSTEAVSGAMEKFMTPTAAKKFAAWFEAAHSDDHTPVGPEQTLHLQG